MQEGLSTTKNLLDMMENVSDDEYFEFSERSSDGVGNNPTSNIHKVSEE